MRALFFSLCACITLGACGAADGDAGRSRAAAQAACRVKGPAEPVFCDELYHPVCGCDGKTYANLCAASVRVTSWLEGECVDSSPACLLGETVQRSCPELDKPVCGCDGTTYKSACEAGGYITSWIDGECTVSTKCTAHPSESQNCTESDKPVCGCDGRTYGNACKAGNAVASWVAGECYLPEDTTPGAGQPHGPAPDAACVAAVSERPVCVEVDEPVCGCDGLTYESACEARGFVTAWTDGACSDEAR